MPRFVRATRVLLADDDLAFRSALRSVLAAQGCEVLEASDGEAAVNLLAQAADGTSPRPDILVLDVLMPGCSGLGVLEVMRRFVREVPAIVVTGFRDGSIDVLARRLGARRVIHKPVELDDVLAAIAAELAAAEE